MTGNKLRINLEMKEKTEINEINYKAVTSNVIGNHTIFYYNCLIVKIGGQSANFFKTRYVDRKF